jgi:hypothetical protein
MTRDTVARALTIRPRPTEGGPIACMAGSLFVGFWLGMAVHALLGPLRISVPESVQVLLVALVGAAVGVVGVVMAASISGRAATRAAKLQTDQAHDTRFADRKREVGAQLMDDLFVLLDGYDMVVDAQRRGVIPPDTPRVAFYREARELRLIVDRAETYAACERLVDAMVQIRRVAEATPFVDADMTPLVTAVRNAQLDFEREMRNELRVATLPSSETESTD